MYVIPACKLFLVIVLVLSMMLKADLSGSASGASASVSVSNGSVSAGESHTLVVRRSGITSNVDRWDGAREVAGGWKETNWFGQFIEDSTGWIYHLKHGWMYPHGDDAFLSMWLYSESLGWVWTSSDSYPQLYSRESQSWLYFKSDSGSRGRFYDYKNNRWK